MSKAQNHIIVIGGVLFIIGIIIFGVFKFFVYMGDDVELGKQILDFFMYVIPASLATGLLMTRVLNLQEKKELKEKTDQSNEYAVEIKYQQQEIKELQNQNHEQLSRIEETIASNESNENKRNAALLKRFEDQLLREGDHVKDHDSINKKLGSLDEKYGSLEKKITDHIKHHSKQTA